MDMVCVVRQLAEKAVEHHTSSSLSLWTFAKLMTLSHEKPCGWC